MSDSDSGKYILDHSKNVILMVTCLFEYIDFLMWLADIQLLSINNKWKRIRKISSSNESSQEFTANILCVNLEIPHMEYK